MRSFSTIGALLAGCAAPAIGACAPSSSDMTAVQFAYSVQNLLLSYYNSVPVNQTFFSTLPNNTVPYTDFLANVEGLQRQAQLGVDALEQLSSKAPGQSQMPTCTYHLPTPEDAKAHLMYAQHIESTLCGTFIGLADYVQCPEIAFLMARLAAGHSNHAAYIGSHMKAQIYMVNSTSLLPAFKPTAVMTPGRGVGHLGQWMNNCTAMPSAPCGGQVTIGKLGSNITSTFASSSSASASAMHTSAAAASTLQNGLKGIVGVMIGAALI